MMIKKIMVLSDFYEGQHKFIKTGANLRITYMLRKLGYEVMPIHHCMAFTAEEMAQIIDGFAAGEQIMICMSTSFLMTRNIKNLKYVENTETDPKSVEAGDWWGTRTFKFMMDVFAVADANDHKVVLGGWGIIKQKFTAPVMRHAWGIDILSEHVDCFSLGNNLDIVEKICRGEPFDHQVIGNSVVAESSPITDFSDCASTPLPGDHIAHGESLMTEIAAGCIFSCAFCDYGALGKKKKEFVRSYDSLKAEILSNYENFGTRVYTLSDNIVNDYEEKLRYLIRIREETGIDLRWVGYIRLDTIKTKEHAKLIAESGIAGCVFGIESFKPETGRYIGKMTDKSRLIGHLEMFREAVGNECLTMGSFIAGLPTETKDEVRNTFEWLQSPHGRDMLDSYTFSTLLLFEGNDDKNDINRSRNNPFKDYDRKAVAKWTSPWGTYFEFSDLANQFNMARKNTLGGFTPALVHNVGLDIKDVVKAGRFIKDVKQHMLFKNTDALMEGYKKKVLDSIAKTA
jgi:hypothetical protein